MSFDVPRDLQLTADRSDLLLIQGGDEIRQKCDMALQIFQGTWIFDALKGLRFKDLLFGKPANEALWRAEVARTLGEVAGVKRVTSVRTNYDRARRHLTVTWEASTAAGTVRSEVTFR